MRRAVSKVALKRSRCVGAARRLRSPLRSALQSFMRFTTVLIAIVALLSRVAGTASETDPWSVAEQAIVRVPENSFPNLPERVRHVLRELRCLVPQPGDRVAAREPPVNAISGQFARAGQIDWAILCSSGGRSSIYVVWGGPATCSAPLATAADRDYLQGRGDQRIDFSREIIVAGPKQIMATYRYYDEVPPRVSHDAIEDIFVDKASVRYHCDAGAWRKLLGAD